MTIHVADRLTHWLFVPDRSCAFQRVVAFLCRFGQAHVEEPAPDPGCWKTQEAWSSRIVFERSRWTCRARWLYEERRKMSAPSINHTLFQKLSDGGASLQVMPVLGSSSLAVYPTVFDKRHWSRHQITLNSLVNNKYPYITA